MKNLNSITREEILDGPLPLEMILRNSAYYPSCYFDGRFIRYCNLYRKDWNISSYLYCDFGVDESSFLKEQDHFNGYEVFASRLVSQDELVPNGWVPSIPPGIEFGNREPDWLGYYLAGSMTVRNRPYPVVEKDRKPFIMWTVYQRKNDHDDKHGPARFSLLYLGGEGVATYQAIYWSNHAYPAILVLIHPDGLGWTSMRNKNGPLAWVVRNNPSGRPDYLMIDSNVQDNPHYQWNGYTFHERTNQYSGYAGDYYYIYNRQ
jgi:hypothetical protein